MDSSDDLRITEDLLPGIRANVFVRKIWYAIGALLLWGAIDLLFWVGPMSEEGGAAAPPPWQLPAAVGLVYYGVPAIAGIMILFALYGLVTRHPRTLLLVAVAVILGGAWCLLAAGVVFAVARAGGDGPEAIGPAGYWGVLGIVQIVWGLRELSARRRLLAWVVEIEQVTPDQRRRAKRFLAAFMKADEDFFAGRIRGGVTDQSILRRSNEWRHNGQLLDDRLVLVSPLLGSCLSVTRQDARQGKFNRKHPSVRLLTDQGQRRFRPRPQSMLALKRWAGVPVDRRDVLRAVRQKKASARLMAAMLEDAHQSVRLAALEGLKHCPRGDDPAPVAVGCLDDPDPVIQAAAIEVCVELRLDTLHARAVQFLRHGDARVRAAAADYIRAFPLAETWDAVHAAAQVEQDRKARGQMDKALRACEKAGANPYTRS